MKFTKTFEELGKGDAKIAGGKGASLGEMTRTGIPVPPGYVVTAQAFDYFLEQAGIKADIESLLEKVNHKDTNSVENASGEIQAIIKSATMPEEIESEILSNYLILNTVNGKRPPEGRSSFGGLMDNDSLVAVRSSATAEDSSNASWAGELDSFLNTTEKTLLENVKNCWASLFTPRAIFYRIEKNLHVETVSVAVVVQKMIQSEVSGIAFTVHPVTEDRNQMVIEAGWGLGEAIVGGIITPDTFVIDKLNIKNKISNIEQIITERYISEQEIMIVRSEKGTEEKSVPEDKREKQKISDEKLLELAKLCLGIEKHYGFPCDIEWAMEDNKLYIVQSRPITTLS